LKTAKAGLMERFSVWMEVEILSHLTPKDGVGPVFRWIFKIPILYYKLGLGWMLEKRFLLLKTTGRRSGKLRQTPLEFVYNAQDDSYRVSPGWGGKTDWYKNVLNDPLVTVQVGRRKFKAVAESAPDEEAAEFMMNASHRHPSMDKIWNRWSDRPVDGSRQSYIYAAKYFPSVRLRPQTHEKK
jgi:deazaflavin-dependent oxidoreductase (nitroreductase family)